MLCYATLLINLNPILINSGNINANIVYVYHYKAEIHGTGNISEPVGIDALPAPVIPLRLRPRLRPSRACALLVYQYQYQISLFTSCW